MMTNQNKHSKAPTHIVYSIKEDAGKEIWLKVGAGWVHGDKEGLNISLSHLGQNINFVIRPNKTKPE